MPESYLKKPEKVLKSQKKWFKKLEKLGLKLLFPKQSTAFSFFLFAESALPPKIWIWWFSTTWRRKCFFRHSLHTTKETDISFFLFMLSMRFLLEDPQIIHVPTSRKESFSNFLFIETSYPALSPSKSDRLFALKLLWSKMDLTQDE